MTKPANYKARIILAPQSAGRIGKSTTAEAILEWASFADIRKAVLDLDTEHRTISARYPEISAVMPDAAGTDDGWQRLMLALDPAPAPMILADMPAQASEHLLRQLAERGGLEVLERLGVRLTCLIFAAEDTAARQSAVAAVRALGDRADWLVVFQPGPKPLAKDWHETKLASRLKELGASELRLPQITRATLEAYEGAVKQAGKWLPFAAAAQLLPIASGFELEYWRNQALVGCEDAAHLLVPDLGLIKNKVTRVADKIAIKPVGLNLDL